VIVFESSGQCYSRSGCDCIRDTHIWFRDGCQNHVIIYRYWRWWGKNLKYIHWQWSQTLFFVEIEQLSHHLFSDLIIWDCHQSQNCSTLLVHIKESHVWYFSCKINDSQFKLIFDRQLQNCVSICNYSQLNNNNMFYCHCKNGFFVARRQITAKEKRNNTKLSTTVNNFFTQKISLFHPMGHFFWEKLSD